MKIEEIQAISVPEGWIPPPCCLGLTNTRPLLIQVPKDAVSTSNNIFWVISKLLPSTGIFPFSHVAGSDQNFKSGIPQGQFCPLTEAQSICSNFEVLTNESRDFF